MWIPSNVEEQDSKLFQQQCGIMFIAMLILTQNLWTATMNMLELAFIIYKYWTWTWVSHVFLKVNDYNIKRACTI